MPGYLNTLGEVAEWPYPVNYNKENKVESDILVIGGGLAGCHAAINATKRGATVAIVDKGPIIRSGSGGSGIDHWGEAFTNPCSKVTPDEMIEAESRQGEGYGSRHTSYIQYMESYDALLDIEKMGVKVRDEDDEFAGAEFRDEETKLMFAFDYESKLCIRIQGALMKPALYKELKKLGVNIQNRIMVTSLLTEGGIQGAKVVGATGVHIRTGEFYIFKAKAVIMATAAPNALWIFNTELTGGAVEHSDPNCTGEGHAMSWLAGAEFVGMESSGISGGPFRYPAYGVGNWHNTWFPCNMVDANGKEIPWVDRDGKILKTVSERCRPAKGQKFLSMRPSDRAYEFKAPQIIPDLNERIAKGEYKLPLYADLPSMPEHERRAIFGLMVAHEGKTRIPVYETYTQAGFDPDRDMLQANIMHPDAYRFGDYFQARAMGAPQWRSMGMGAGGALMVGWELMTNVDGLFAAGAIAKAGGCSGASAAGRFAGRRAAEYIKTAKTPSTDREQIETEKRRVYASVNRTGDFGWKELYAGTARIMQDYCGLHRSEEVLKTGLEWLNSIRESEGANTVARNPHELVRTLECLARITVGEMAMHASLARKASSRPLGFNRTDYPEMDPPEWKKFITTRLDNGDIKVGERPLGYCLLPPYAPTYKENYEKYSEL